MSSAEQDVTLRLRTRAEGDAGRPFRDIGAAARDAAAAEQRYQGLLRQRGGLGGGGLGGGGGGGGLGAAGGVAAVAAATMMVGKFLGETVARNMNIQNDPFLANAQKSRLSSENLPVVGHFAKWWHDFQDALSGVDAAMKRIERNYVERAQQAEVNQKAALRGDAGAAEAAHYARRAGALGGLHFGAPPGIDRSTVLGEIAFTEQQRLLPAQDAARRAEALSKAAAAEKRDSDTRLNLLETERRRARDRHADARGREQKALDTERILGGPEEWYLPGNKFAGGGEGRMKAERQSAGREAMLAGQQVLDLDERISAERERNKQLAVGAAEAESAARRASIDVQKEELALLQQKEQRIRGDAARVGLLNAVDRQLGLAATRRIRGAGGDLSRLTPLEIQHAQRFNPAFVQKAGENFGRNTPEYRAEQKEGGFDKESLQEVRQQIEKVQTQVRISVNLDELALAKEIGQEVGRSLMKFIRDIQSEGKDALEKMRSEQQLRNNNAGG